MKHETLTSETNEAQAAVAMSREVLSNLRDMNGFLTTSHKVRRVFHAHYADMEAGEFGIADLIARILRENEAIFPAGVETTELRQIAISGAMFTDEIIAKVQAYFTAGSIRYPEQTIRAYLSVFMFRSKQVGKIQLTAKEDIGRPCYKPRCKWYLINQ